MIAVAPFLKPCVTVCEAEQRSECLVGAQDRRQCATRSKGQMHPVRWEVRRYGAPGSGARTLDGLNRPVILEWAVLT